jgi:RND superfamily putative drug exporter
MVSVFGAFALSTELILKLIGVGLASAILIDGILIRMVLLPAVMHLLGERAWWRRGGKEDPQPPTKRVDEPLEGTAHEELVA